MPETSEMDVVSRFAAILDADTAPDEGARRRDEDVDETEAVASEQDPEADFQGVEDEGDEPEDEDAEVEAEGADDSEGPDQDLAFTVLVDGKDVQVTHDEARNGYLRYQDYTRKTMALAEERKALDGQLTEVRTKEQQYAAILPQLEHVIQRSSPQRPDDNLYRSDPAEYVRQMAAYEEGQRQLEAVQAERQRLAHEHAARQAQEIERARLRERQALAERLPEWADAPTAQKEQAMIREYGLGIGLTQQELDSVEDHRFVLVLRDAARYRSLQANGKVKAKEAKTTTKTLPGGAGERDGGQNRALREQRKRLKETGRPKDAVPLMRRFLEG